MKKKNRFIAPEWNGGKWGNEDPRAINPDQYKEKAISGVSHIPNLRIGFTHG